VGKSSSLRAWRAEEGTTHFSPSRTPVLLNRLTLNSSSSATVQLSHHRQSREGAPPQRPLLIAPTPSSSHWLQHRREHFLHPPSSSARPHHRRPLSVALWPAQQLHELPMESLPLYDPELTADDHPTMPPPVFPLHRLALPSPDSHGEPPVIFCPKSRPPCLRLAPQPHPHRPPAGRIWPRRRRRRQGCPASIFQLWAERPYRPGRAPVGLAHLSSVIFLFPNLFDSNQFRIWFKLSEFWFKLQNLLKLHLIMDSKFKF
jgi:hypothetical protein